MIAHFGLDLGSDTLKIAQIDKIKDGFRLVKAGMANNPNGNLNLDSDAALIRMAEALKRLKSDVKISSEEVALALPERNIFTQVIQLPKMTEDELKQAVPWEAENLVPQPLAEVSLSWQVIPEKVDKGATVKVLLIAAPLAVIEKYTRLCKLANLQPLLLETQTLAELRCLRSINPNLTNFILVNLGERSLDITVVKEGNLYLTRSLPTAGEALTRSIVTSLSLDPVQAEEYKKVYGLSNQAEGKILASLTPILDVASNEVKKAVRYYEEKENDVIKLLVLAGGSALLPGIGEYFTARLGVEIQIADPVSFIQVDESVRAVLKERSPMFLTVFGLAMNEL